MELQFREITLADKPLFHKTLECSFAYVYKYVITEAGLEKEEDDE